MVLMHYSKKNVLIRLGNLRDTNWTKDKQKSRFSKSISQLQYVKHIDWQTSTLDYCSIQHKGLHDIFIFETINILLLLVVDCITSDKLTSARLNWFPWKSIHVFYLTTSFFKT